MDVRELTDRQGNAAPRLQAFVDQTHAAYAAGERVVVCCDRGMSRSNAVALGALMKNGSLYRQGLALLSQKVPLEEMNLGLLRDLRSLFQGPADPITLDKSCRVLVTGAHGFLGTHLCRALVRDYEALGPSRLELDLSGPLALIEAYIVEHEISHIVHLAHPRARNGVSAMASATAMLKNLLEVCRFHGTFLLFVSSLSVFSGHASLAPLAVRGDTAPHPKGTYGETKFLSETLIDLYRRNYDIRASVIRPAGVYGPGMEPAAFVSKFFEAALAGRSIRTHRYRNGLPTFDFVYVDDLVQGIQLGLDRHPQTPVHLGTGVGTSTFDFANMVVEVVGSSSTVETVDIDDTVTNVIVDPAEATQVLGWDAITRLRDGLGKVAAWFGNARLNTGTEGSGNGDETDAA